MAIQFPSWTLNYQVAAIGAYATILVESIYLILGGGFDASLLSISILTNGSAVLVAGLGGASSTPFAIIRICLTSLFLLCASILPENEKFDGTYAILCSVAHLFYHLRLRYNENSSEGFLPQHEKPVKTEETPSGSCVDDNSIDHNDAATFSRNLRIFFGDSICLEGAMVPITILGTIITYRVFDFDLGFGLVFAFMSAFLSSAILTFMNYARTRGRRMHTQIILKRLISLVSFFGVFSFVFFTTADFPDIEFSWWRIAFGLAWFIFLFWTTYVACRFTIHATLFSCAACSQREAGVQGPLTQEASTCCVWDNYVTLPALNQNEDDGLSGHTTFRVRRQKGPDLVERFWLNDQDWFQISPRCFVIFLVSCIILGWASGSSLTLNGTFANISPHFAKISAFYVTMAFTFVSTGHSPMADSPELMNAPLKDIFPNWKATARAVIATTLVHAFLVFVPYSAMRISFATPLACTIVAPLLLAGLSKRLNSIDRETDDREAVEEETVDENSRDLSTSCTKAWIIDSALVYSSSRIRCLDLRVLLLGLSFTLFDVLCNQYQDERAGTRWPPGAVISISVTAIWLYLENTVPESREVEPGLLYLASAALVGIFIQFSFPGVFKLYGNASQHENPILSMHGSNDASYSNPFLIALWYTILILMIVANRKLVQQRADQALPITNGQPHKRDYLLFSFHVRKSGFNMAWQLRNSRIAIPLLFMMLGSWMGESWPLDMKTTITGLLLFVIIGGFQLRPTRDILEEKRSRPHLLAIAFSTVMTILALGLDRLGVLEGFVSDPKSDWKAGTWSAFVSYQFFVAVSLWLLGKGYFKQCDDVEEPPTAALQDEISTTQVPGKKQIP